MFLYLDDLCVGHPFFAQGLVASESDDMLLQLFLVREHDL